MTLKIAVCDDIDSERQLLISMIKAEYATCECTPYDSGEALLWDFENGKHHDIFFLDIYMNGINGVEVAKRIRSSNPDALLIFVSSSNDFYRESYDLYAFNYLIKPMVKEKLSEVLHHATVHLGKEMNPVVQFSFDNDLYTIRCSQLLYLVSDKHIVNFHMTNGETLKSYGKMDDLISQLPAKVFVRCHQSYIVNLKHVTGMTAGEFMLGNIKVPISRKYSSHAREQYRVQMFHDF
ncbi:MAG: LytTR family DNA-binding domain-containing protein [Clostridiaceae bacterium]